MARRRVLLPRRPREWETKSARDSRRAPVATAIVLAGSALLLAGCGSGWGWYEVLPTTPRGRDNFFFLLSGFWLTIAISGTALVFSVLLGLAIALPGLAKDKRLRWLNRAYVEVFRAIPVLVMLLWTYYGLPILLDVSLTPFVAGVVALALCDSAFEAEIFRAGIQSIERGQLDGADSLGLSYWQKMRFVVLPQAIRRILPALGNQFVYMLKMSSLVYVLGLPELTRRANELSVTVYRPLEIYSVLVAEYLVLILAVAWLVRRLEHRLSANQLQAER